LKNLYVATAVLAALVVGGYAWLRDEAPSPEVQSWLQQLDARPDQSAAYLFLNGLDAPVVQNPADLGAKRLEAYQRWVAEHGDGEHFVAARHATLDLPEGPEFCSVEQSDCFNELIARGPQPLSPEQATLLERYQQLLLLDDYHTLTFPSLYEPMLPLKYLIRGNQLQALEALRLAKSGDGAAALALLENDMARLRQQLVAADQLLLKMMFVHLLNHDLDWLARLYRHGLIPAPAKLASLSEAERSMQQAFLHEFGGGPALFHGLGQDEVSNMVGNQVLGRLALLLAYKPQMTINASIVPYQRAAVRSQLSPEAFRQTVLADTQTQPPASLRNKIGSVLLAVAVPDFNIYIGRMHDLDAKLKLLNLLPELPDGAAPNEAQLAALADAGNPYQPDQPPFWNVQTGQLCYTGPLPERKGSRCL
jgi:hypothetical protein